MPQSIVNKDLCKGCERCVIACPQKILSMSTDLNVKGYFYARVHDPSRCIGCAMCAIACPDVAIQIGINGAQYHFFEY